jgi:hypothetical protein
MIDKNAEHGDRTQTVDFGAIRLSVHCWLRRSLKNGESCAEAIRSTEGILAFMTPPTLLFLR